MQGKLFIIVGPSGSGKSSVMHGLKKRHPEYTYPLSATTRPMRPGEKDGDIYYFYTKDRFEDGIEKDEFLEWAIVHQTHYYGLLKKPVMDALKDGKTVVREVDIQGLESIQKAMQANDLVSIFIAAPKDELVKRIKARSKMSDEELKHRIDSMHKEFLVARDCDYMVENQEGELEQTIKKVEKIIKQETA